MPYFPPEFDLSTVAARTGRHAALFTLPLRDRNWRGNPGDHAGLGVGSSLDFQDHRNYLPGDDPRHINWQAYARTGDYTLKLYREEVRPVVEIVFDVSGSMFALPEKAERSTELFLFCDAAARQSGATARLHLAKGGRWKRIEPASVVSGQWTAIAEEMPPTDSSEPPDLSPIPFSARSMRILISDLLFSSPPETTIRTLVKNSGSAVVLCPFSHEESDPGWEGNYEFRDTETNVEHVRRVDPPLLRRYHDAYRRHFDGWKAAAIRARVPLARFPAEGKFEVAARKEAVPSGALQLA